MPAQAPPLPDKPDLGGPGSSAARGLRARIPGLGSPKKTAVRAVVAVVVLLVAGFGFTALVAPGFLRTGDARPAGTAAEDSTSTPAKSSGPEALIQHLVRAANAKDVDGMSDLACSEVGPNVRSAIADIGTTDGAELAGSTSVSGDKRSGPPSPSRSTAAPARSTSLVSGAATTGAGATSPPKPPPDLRPARARRSSRR